MESTNLFTEHDHTLCDAFRQGLQDIKIMEEWLNVPRGLTKKEYTSMFRENKKMIEEQKLEIREANNKLQDTIHMSLRMDELLEREQNIKKRLNFFNLRFDGPDRLAQAKQIPLEDIMDFKHGFALCPHGEKTPSLKLYTKNNTWFCFSCQKGGDSVDLVMYRDGITLPEAVKLLLRT